MFLRLSPRLESNTRRQAFQFPPVVPVLRDLVEELARKVDGVFDDLESFPEALGLLLLDACHHAVRLDDAAPFGCERHRVRLGKHLLDQRDRLARRPQRLQVSERLRDPVPDLPVLRRQRRDVRPARDEGRVEQRRAHPVVLVVWYHALAGRPVLTLGVDGLASGADDDGQCPCGGRRAADARKGNGVVAVADDDGDAPRRDGRDLGRELDLGEAGDSAAVILFACHRGRRGADHGGHLLREGEIDLSHAQHHAVVHDGVVAVVELEAEGLGDVRLLVVGKRVVEQLRLAVMFAHLGVHGPVLVPCAPLRVALERALLDFYGRTGVEAVGPVVHRSLGDLVPHLAVAVVVHDGADRAVDRQLFPVDSQPRDLGVEVGEVAALEERVVGEVDAGHDVAGAEGDLLGLGEELVDVAVELQFADDAQRDLVLGPDLGGVEDVELEVVLALLGDDLDREVPFRVDLVVDGLHEVLAVEIRVLARQFHRLVPDERVDAQVGDPVELAEVPFAFLVDEGERVDAEALHHAEGSWDRAVRHHPHEHVGDFGVQEGKVPEVVMGCLGLGDFIVWFWLYGVDWICQLS